MSDLFTPPRYFQDVTFHKHTDRTIGWLELFYDLVYVATLIQIGNFLSDNLTLDRFFGQFLVLMFVLWWSWSGEPTARGSESPPRCCSSPESGWLGSAGRPG